MQLKALVRNLSGGDSAKAQMIIRAYAMERFLERLSQSQYHDKIIVKGDVLVTSMIGLDNRSTFDIDTTVKGLPLSEDTIADIIREIATIPVNDNMAFEVQRTATIMDEMDYPGVRITLEAHLDSMRIPLRIDVSTDDVITPREMSYQYGLLFEDREISLLAYNLETILAEKLETLLSRGVANTRMRDYYDLFALSDIYSTKIDYSVLKEAYDNTSADRGTSALLKDANLILGDIESNDTIQKHWARYQKKYDYAANISFADTMHAIRTLFSAIFDKRPKRADELSRN
ncbi:MAG: nucleotidyl transferase AbiEii/AbiGii toxin family protein [Coriobacteriia bacterium]|nr:nucleotidyl transferase AbiEii/AbiGii toxin family protein [Coriobacteriia bacterium]